MVDIIDIIQVLTFTSGVFFSTWDYPPYITIVKEDLNLVNGFILSQRLSTGNKS